MKTIVIVLSCWWLILTTMVTWQIELEYKWQAWTIIAWGPIVVIAGLWEVVNRVFGGRGK